MDRKHFLGTLLALPVGIFLVNCSSSDDSSSTPAGSAGSTASAGSSGADPNAPAAAPTQSNGMDVYTSSTVSQHSHTFTLDDTAITTPPSAGVSGDSSDVGMHTHTVAISMDQLTQVGMGQSVQVTSGVAGGHTHVFTFVKIA